MIQEKLKFPDDYLEDERMKLRISELFLAIFSDIELAETAKKLKARDKSTYLETTQIITTLFESNDFELFENIIKVTSTDLRLSS